MPARLKAQRRVRKILLPAAGGKPTGDENCCSSMEDIRKFAIKIICLSTCFLLLRRTKKKKFFSFKNFAPRHMEHKEIRNLCHNRRQAMVEERHAQSLTFCSMMNLKDFDPVETNCKLHSSVNFSAIVEGNNRKSVFSALQIYCYDDDNARKFLFRREIASLRKILSKHKSHNELKRALLCFAQKVLSPSFFNFKLRRSLQAFVLERGSENFQFPVGYRLYPS